MALPFGQTLRLWRLERGLTQEQLAQAARLPRPNLSAIERGKREVSLSTLRTLALALDTTPGALVDGVPPAASDRIARLSRQAMERIADGVVYGKLAHQPDERALVALLRRVIRPRALEAWRPPSGRRLSNRAVEIAWLQVRAACPPAVLHSLIQRIEDRQRLHVPETD